MKRVATLALMISLPAYAGAIDLPCPENIQTSQSIESDHPGWHAASSNIRAKNGISTHLGRPVGFSSGPAREGAL
ncbi:STY0301 family protein, partial [Arenimonas donghaensis]|uniref:STY0301 family protein n=1 Tax=Arenimonas donghaensis TaxID=375061 RepID=UPI001B8044B2